MSTSENHKAPSRLPMCSFCYAPLQAPLRCGGCSKQPYCSKECQRFDWKQHKIWCGRVAQIGVDFELRDAGAGKGLGYFALRDFAVGEKVLAEIPIIQVFDGSSGGVFHVVSSLQSQFESLPAHIQALLLDLRKTQWNSAQMEFFLKSSDSPVYERFHSNSFSLADDHKGGTIDGILIHGSRFNHACIPNCTHYFFSVQNVMMFSVCNKITSGSEMTISYRDPSKFGLGFDGYRDYYMNGWGFECCCPSCSDHSTFAKLETFAKIIDQMMALVSEVKHALKTTGDAADIQFMTSEAIKLGEVALQLSDDLGFGFSVTQRKIYFNIFYLARMHRSDHLKISKQYRAKFLEMSEMEMSGPTVEITELARIRLIVADIDPTC